MLNHGLLHVQWPLLFMVKTRSLVLAETKVYSSQVLVGKQDLKLARPLEIGKEISAFVHGFGSSWNVKSQD